MLFYSFVARKCSKWNFSVLLLTIIAIFLLHQLQQNTRNFQYQQISSTLKLDTNVNNNKNIPVIQESSSPFITRALIVYYPDTQEAHFLPELLWLYHSWTNMMKYEPSSWRTDLTIYTGDLTFNLDRLGCIYNRIRTNRTELPQCRVFPYRRVNIRGANDRYNTNDHLYQQYDHRRSMLLKQYLDKYGYLDSINVIAECYPSFSMYDYILRTDLDVFLTPNFARFIPINNTFVVGGGGYSTPFNSKRLRRIATNMHWSYANITNIGSTWYGRPHVAQRVANFSLEAMLYLSMNEFTDVERQGRLGALLWPDWHHGVLLLYSCELAMNHLILTENLEIGLGHRLLDRQTTEIDPQAIEKGNILHLHAWHTFDKFSKFSFKDGAYDRIHPSTFANDTSPRGFAMRMALESRFKSLLGLKEQLRNAKKPNS